MAIVAVLNGGLREAVLIPHLGEGIARPASAVILIAVILALSVLHQARLGGIGARQAWGVALLWLALTLVLETGLGLMQGQSRAEMLAAYHPGAPGLWLYVIAATLIAPPLVQALRARASRR